jgi:hypothetical protein
MALLKLAPILEAGLVSTTANARSGRTSATSAAVGGPGWLYGQARNWATRDSTTPPPRTWGSTGNGAGGSRTGHGPGKGGSAPWAAAAGAAAQWRPAGVATQLADRNGPSGAPQAAGASSSTSGRRRIGDNNAGAKN